MEGHGVPEAGKYDPASPGPHRLVILDVSGVLHEWNRFVPSDWLPSTIGENELVVLLGQEREIALDTMSYVLPSGSEAPPITRYRFEMDVEVREARTGQALWTATLRGSMPGSFPDTAPVGQTRLDGTHVTYSLLEAFLCPKLSGLCTSVTFLNLGWHTDKVTDIVVSPDRQLLASGSWDKTVRLWRVSDGALLHEFWLGDEIADIAFSPDGDLLASASASREGKVVLWQAPDWTYLHSLVGHTGMVSGLAFSPDGQTLASGSLDGTVRLWHVSDGVLLHVLEAADSVSDIAFSPDGSLLASASMDGSVQLWRVSDGILLHALEGHTDCAGSVAFSLDGQMLASASDDGTVRLWQVSDGTLLRILEGHTDWVTGVVFSPDGQILASQSLDNTVRVWHVPDGVLLHSLEHPDHVRVTFSPDGQMLASACDDSTVRLWRVSDGTLLHALEGHIDRVIDVVFLSNQQLASASADGTIRLWYIP